MESMMGMMERKESLVSTQEGDISLCRCGIYHVQINNIAFYLSEAQFNAIARLFKLAFGLLAARRLYPEPVYSGMGITRGVSGECRPKEQFKKNSTTKRGGLNDTWQCVG